eukprot:scaffold16659_cov89-Skeletonema_marinoi.AAC.2
MDAIDGGIGLVGVAGSSDRCLNLNSGKEKRDRRAATFASISPKVSKAPQSQLYKYNALLQLLDRSADTFEVLFVWCAKKYLFDQQSHSLEYKRKRWPDEIKCHERVTKELREEFAGHLFELKNFSKSSLEIVNASSQKCLLGKFHEAMRFRQSIEMFLAFV